MVVVLPKRNVGVLLPIVPAQVGISEAEQVLCASSAGINVAQIITLGFGLYTMYLILKGLIRVMVGTDNAGATELVGSDGIRRTDAAPGYGRQQVQGGILSCVAALMPVFIPVFLAVVGINVVECLL